jgi:hypothetical protein
MASRPAIHALKDNGFVRTDDPPRQFGFPLPI